MGKRIDGILSKLEQRESFLINFAIVADLSRERTIYNTHLSSMPIYVREAHKLRFTAV